MRERGMEKKEQDSRARPINELLHPGEKMAHIKDIERGKWMNWRDLDKGPVGPGDCLGKKKMFQEEGCNLEKKIA
jgi:hypothetical protein